jgi:hypothetical protein
MRAATLLTFLLLALPAHGMVRVPGDLQPIPDNPANKLAALPIEDFVYDDATRCTPNKRRPGVDAFRAWILRNADGADWGSYRCEKWGPGQASLHAEGRALDWHPASAREARRLILLLLAPDTAGNVQALARRMGVQEIIWDCGYWRSGMPEFSEYAPCYGKRGRPKKHVNATVAHRDHVHFGFSKPGSARSTSFWSTR